MAPSLKEKIKNLSPEKKEELKQYADSVKEIKRKIKEILNEAGKVQERGGDMMHKTLKP
jgi:diadenosine tetraphosphate (Ap4A) HIT family hydrolase